MRSQTIESRRLLYLRARVIVARHYGRRLTLPVLAGALASSPRELQRAYAQFGELTFREDLQARRLAAAVELLRGQPSIAVGDVARLVGYSQPPHFGRVFLARYGLSPGRFRERARQPELRSPGGGQLSRGAVEAIEVGVPGSAVASVSG